MSLRNIFSKFKFFVRIRVCQSAKAQERVFWFPSSHFWLKFLIILLHISHQHFGRFYACLPSSVIASNEKIDYVSSSNIHAFYLNSILFYSWSVRYSFMSKTPSTSKASLGCVCVVNNISVFVTNLTQWKPFQFFAHKKST